MAETLSTQTPLRHRLAEALKLAEARDPDGAEAATLRLITCAMRDRDISARSRGDCEGCEETDLRALLEMMASQRQLSAKEYDEAGRVADAEREREELAVIRSFLPKPLDGPALETAVNEVITELEASKLKDMGRCMAELKSRYPHRIDTGKVGKLVREALR